MYTVYTVHLMKKREEKIYFLNKAKTVFGTKQNKFEHEAYRVHTEQ